QARAPITLFGDGSARRDFIHVDDVADVVHRLGSLPDRVRVRDVASGGAVSLVELIDLLARLVGVEPIIEHVAARPSDVPAVTLDVTRLRRALEFHPRSLDAGISTILTTGASAL